VITDGADKDVVVDTGVGFKLVVSPRAKTPRAGAGRAASTSTAVIVVIVRDAINDRTKRIVSHRRAVVKFGNGNSY
jgi:hypothetical protein